jgi:hypothetical protein
MARGAYWRSFHVVRRAKRNADPKARVVQFLPENR